MQDEITEKVLQFSNNFDFETIRETLEDLKSRDNEKTARNQLKIIFGEDDKQIKMLSCMLQCAVELYERYQQKNISNEIYVATMKCFTRFINECKSITGEYAFDREWWTSRQIGFRLFRIGELEYELKERENKPVISIHIPSDSEFSEKACSDSLKMANDFFEQNFKGYKNCDYICHSWLLAPELRQLLPQTSNILKFQDRFDIIDVEYTNSEYIEWVFKKRDVHYVDLPETTSLQKKMKEYLLLGGTIGSGLGVLKKERVGIEVHKSR